MIAVDVDVVDGDVVVVLSPVVAAAAAGATAGTNAVGRCGLSFLRPCFPFFFLFKTIVTKTWRLVERLMRCSVPTLLGCWRIELDVDMEG